VQRLIAPPPEPQIMVCTALIDSGEHTRLWLSPTTIAATHIQQKVSTDRAPSGFRSIDQINSTNPKHFQNRGVAYSKKGEYDLAIENLDEAIRLKPNYAKAFVKPARKGNLPEKKRVRSAARDLTSDSSLIPQLEKLWSRTLLDPRDP